MFQPPSREFGEKAFDGIEPGARGWGKVKGPAGMPGKPGADFFVLMSGVVVENGVDDFACGDLSLDGVQEADELLMAVALHVLSDHRAIEHVQCGKQRRCAVALIIMGPRPASSLLERQARLGPVEGLDLAFLIHRDHHGVGRRRDIKTNNIVQFFGKGRVFRQFEGPPAVGCEPVIAPHFCTVEAAT